MQALSSHSAGSFKWDYPQCNAQAYQTQDLVNLAASNSLDGGGGQGQGKPGSHRGMRARGRGQQQQQQQQRQQQATRRNKTKKGK
ncbi:predicted protein [Plenodomus lingam JN3]|uniref:Predicted protein n=1 Tax=Leptosphaeria maculans (strain JN3 / isolate v23.1.3 / race Av1-4-5-6-7-8) TaxID=985895 RepID=E4ZSX0_LEPMJ|nr:predicted protein [Plenodomus lingam JN3]CBX94558.1 predicted protein [Plenodomus lingam JN3]